MSGWNLPDQDQISDDVEPVVTLLAGQTKQVTSWSTQLQSDGRFRLVTFANDPNDLSQKLSYNPEAIILDASIFQGPDDLIAFLSRVQGGVYVVLPGAVPENTMADIRSMPSVKNIYIKDINLLELTNRIFTEITVMRRQAPALTMPAQRTGMAAGAITSAMRVITVWNRAGGTGKSTIAVSLAIEAAQRGLRTLLVSLDAPDFSLPLYCKVRTTPNISNWLSAPTYEDGIVKSVQKSGSVDVLVGLQDSLREKDLAVRPEDQPSINSLAIAATYGGYSVVIFDTPVNGNYPAAISASNVIVIPALPMINHALSTAEALRLAFKKLQGAHRVSPANTYIALNRMTNDSIASNDWHNGLYSFAKEMGFTSIPPISVSIPEIPEMSRALNDGRSPLTTSEKFAKPIHQLGETLFGTGGAINEKQKNKASGGVKLFGVTVKTRES